jgi:CRISPR-associated endonuclease/helicase Cas3
MNQPRVPWPSGLDRVWAKSPSDRGQSGETLVHHTWEVLQRCAALTRLRPTLPDEVGVPRLWHLLAWAAFLHDWGKIARGFQAMLRPGGPRWPHRHEVLSLLWLDWVVVSLSEAEATWMAATVASHHKDAEELFQAYPSGLGDEDDPIRDLMADIDRGVVKALWRWRVNVAPLWVERLGLTSAGVGVPPTPTLDPDQLLADGVMRVRYWLSRYRRLVRELSDGGASPLPSLFLLRGNLLQADHIASAGRWHIAPPVWRPAAVLRACGLHEPNLYEHQRRAATHEGSAILIAPTGSGKTEAALLWATAQANSRGGVPRLFYTLPYQASMNAMFDRLEGVFPDKVGLLHGRSVLALYQRLMVEDVSPPEATWRARAAAALARLHAHPVRVFSPFQMLKVAYQLKGYEAMLADYAQGVFVFDEIHAYEPERLAMIVETIHNLRARFGARFLVMSATLPRPVSDRTAEALGNACLIRADDALFNQFARHTVHLLPGELLSAQGLERVLKSLEAGRSVLVACTTVARAQQFYDRVRGRAGSSSGDVVLLHSRFAARDRLRKEQLILEAAGLEGTARRPILLVATQVVEVSLNLDLDTLYSDPAPLEALIQRFGRVNRRHREPTAPVHVFCEPADGCGVYDPSLIHQTLAVLGEQAGGQPLDEAKVQTWLDRIYVGGILAQWEGRYKEAANEFRDAFLATLRPFQSDPAAENRFERLFDGVEVLPKSLLSEYLALDNAGDPLAAAGLLVPITWRRYRGLVKGDLTHTSTKYLPAVVDVDYDDERGLVFADPTP